MSRRGGRAPREPVELTIESLAHEGRGVARLDGKTVFVDGALPGERVTARIRRRRGRFDEAETVSVLEPSPRRVAPPCPHFGVCGGCSLQHMAEDDQLEHKQSVLLELLEHQGGIAPRRVAAPIRGPQWGYRRKARLGVKLVPKKGGVIIGFRERAMPYVTDCSRCDVLDTRVSGELGALRELVQSLSIAARVPQIEVSAGDERVALIVRHLEPLSAADRDALAGFAARTGFDLYLQSGGLDSVTALTPPAETLGYEVEGIRFAFEPYDFTQVNAAINRRIVARAIEHLAPTANDAVLDLYCGIGNFSLPLARRAGHVTGVEGDAGLVARAAANAAANELSNCRFESADLNEVDPLRALDTRVTRVLMDPPRSGAQVLLDTLDLGAVERLVYVSCSPVTFARDAGVLCRRHGFELAETGIADMFPQTAHVESVSLFERA